MTMNLIDFIEARLAEDEQGALNTLDRDWRPDGANSCQVYVAHEDGSNRTIAWCRNGHDDDFANALHIARHDPARVLREVEAKRRTLDLHRGERYDETFVYCRTCGSGEPHEYPTEWPCTTLRLLAMAWSDHPDYHAELAA